MANITECNRLITLDHIKKFIEDLIQDASGNTVSVNLGDYPLTYCPTYSQLTDETFIPFFTQDPQKLSLDKDGIDVSGLYSTNQNTIQGDLKVNFTRFANLGISADTYFVDACSPSTVELLRNLLYDRNVKSASEVCTASSIATSSYTDSYSQVNWHHNSLSGVSIQDDTVFIDPMEGKGGSRDILVSGDTEFREDTKLSTPRELVITQSGICCTCESISSITPTTIIFASGETTPSLITYDAGVCVTVSVESHSDWLTITVDNVNQKIWVAPTVNTGPQRSHSFDVISSDGECRTTAATVTVIQERGCSCNNFSGMSPTEIVFGAKENSAKTVSYTADTCVSVSASSENDWLSVSVDEDRQKIYITPTINIREAREGKVNVTSSFNEHDYVDLGLPSGLKWASMNVGANSIEENGLYFSWGNANGHSEIEGYDFSEDTYNSTSGANLTSNIIPNSGYDAARENMGEPWRMPTNVEIQELSDNCNYTWTTHNGVYGMLFTSRINGNSVFFPASGLMEGTTLYNVGENGIYWASTLYSNIEADDLDFVESTVEAEGNNYRYLGFTVRGVSSEETSCIKKVGEITVYQLSGCSCDNFSGITPSSLSFEAEDFVASSVTYFADDCVNVGVIPNCNWVTATVDRNNKKIWVTPQVNSGAARTTTVSVTSSFEDCTQTAATITVNQESGCTCYDFYGLSTYNLTFESGDTSNTRVNYSAAECVSLDITSNADWIDYSIHNGYIEVRPSSINTKYQDRSGTLSVTSVDAHGNRKPITELGFNNITVTQKKGCSCHNPITISTDNVVFESGDTSASEVTYTADACLTIGASVPSSATSWLSASISGNKIVIKPNSINTSSARTTTVNVTASSWDGTVTSAITVTQKKGCSCENFISFSPNSVTFEAEDGLTSSITYVADDCVTVGTVIPSSATSWLSTSVNQTTKTIQITADVNSGHSRDTSVEITSQFGDCTSGVGYVSISQKSGCTCYDFYGVDTTSVTFASANTNSTTVGYSAAECVTVGATSNASWLTASADTNNGWIYLKPNSINTSSARTTTVTVTSNVGACTKTGATIVVTQERGCSCSNPIIISTNSITFASGTTTASEVGYTADTCMIVGVSVPSSATSWLSASISGNKIVIKPNSINTSAERRTEVNVTTSSWDGTRVASAITATQERGCSCHNFSGVSTDSISLASGDTSSYVYYTADTCVTVGVSVPSDVTWLTASVEPNNQTIRFECAVNTASARTTMVIITSTFGGCTTEVTGVTVSQARGCSCYNFSGVDTTKVTFASGDTTTTIYRAYTADTCVTVNATSNVSWVSVSANNGNIAIIANEINTSAKRSGTITVSSTFGGCSEVMGYITVEQERGCSCDNPFSTSPTSITFAAKGFTTSASTYTADTCMDIDVSVPSSASWLTATVDIDNKKIWVTPQVNSGAARSTIISVTKSFGSCTRGAATISVNQESGCTCHNFTIDTTPITFEASSSSKTVNFQAAECVRVTATQNKSWITTIVRTNYLEISVQDNLGFERVGSVYVTSTSDECSISTAITITQKTGCICSSIVYLDESPSTNRSMGTKSLTMTRSYSAPIIDVLEETEPTEPIVEDNNQVQEEECPCTKSQHICSYQDIGDISPNNVVFGSKPIEAKIVTYTSDTCVNVDAISSEPSWLTASVDNSAKEIWLRALFNTGSSRTAIVTVISSDENDSTTAGTIYVTQESGCTCHNFTSATPTSISFASKDIDAKTLPYEAAECVTVRTSTNASWLTANVDELNKEISLLPSPNSGKTRTATVVITSSDGKNTITASTVTAIQESGCTCHNFRNLTPTEIVFEAKQTSPIVATYESDDCVSVNIETEASWFAIDLDESTKEITITPTLNSGSPRNAMVSVITSDDENSITAATIAVSQESGCTCYSFGNLSTTSITFGRDEEITKPIHYTADTCVNVSTRCNVSWLRISIDSLSKTIWLKPTVNLGDIRTATVEIISSDGEYTTNGGTIIVTQEGTN